ncbi:MAG: hypothetical protein JGK17_07660 [Microcoleus sp. PH2017_10_PVI_O_A]|nr:MULTISPECIES: hypothetical protein [unclassified Microcoleus]MCC3405458.1 hypothetical protein [Microcoleus sp. PH2017_10_PVI_O_A]MCC3459452.1 hypothetical protein [Microcoleus sp. PH2017_11_PCY_U_A]MCC3477731.1 hypothetical protein [Microcoleus sp. PH2017_12_PCY_D_A]MCC3527453.1 hypothetical protein [Microcoleus sp. PH2017_21_RUC_O_A]MCC3539537.1 hypothetical protein [Microcoleus sp. PH2017_22_RUC_O_B]
MSNESAIRGVAIEETDRAVIIEFQNFPYLEVGLLIKGDRGRYSIG